jgi:NAD(P)-dependent dehydrogenase (short-subunit alcohol dehydrogenase family)
MRPRHAVVTGASRGLGAVLARMLAAEGAHVTITARGRAALDATATAMREAGGRVTAVPGDVRDPAHRRAVAAAVGPALDLLVHNASTLGPTPMPPLLEAEPAALGDAFDVNVIAPLALTRALRPALASGAGWVVHLSSDAAHAGYAGWGAYATSKIALELAARTLASEDTALVPSIVDPGDMRTEMHQAAFPGEDISDRPPPEVTVPFWHWLLSQPDDHVRGRRFEAQAEVWEAPSAPPEATAPDVTG